MILEDHTLVREGLQRSLQESFPNAVFVYSGASLEDALAAAHHGCDCAVVDLDLGDGRAAADVVSSLTSQQVPVVVVSALGNPAIIQACVLAGAQGYVAKRSGTDELVAVLRSVLSGRPLMSPDLAGALISHGRSEVKLSKQEQRALVLYASGLKLDSVARRMEVAPSTVKQYLDRVRDKYTAAGRVARTKSDLYRVARDEGLVP
jgi:DNA-binding NarL/FixJ family response regulator